MPFIGIVSDASEENSIRRKIIEKLRLKGNSVLLIKENSIENIKNIKFETIIMARKFKKTETLNRILRKAQYLIVNSDIENNLNLIKNIESTVITYGFNSKATITTSSVGEEEIMLCLQRTIQNKNKEKIEPQELNLPLIENASCTMAFYGIMLIYGIYN